MISDINTTLATAWAPTPATGSQEALTTTVDLAGTALSVMTDPTDGDATIAAGTALNRDIAQGEGLYLLFTCTNASAPTTVANVTFRVTTSDAADNSSNTDIDQSVSVAVASLVSGKQIAIRLSNSTGVTMGRYLGAEVYAGGGSGSLDNLTLNVQLVHGDPRAPVGYPTAFIAPDSF